VSLYKDSGSEASSTQRRGEGSRRGGKGLGPVRSGESGGRVWGEERKLAHGHDSIFLWNVRSGAFRTGGGRNIEGK